MPDELPPYAVLALHEVGDYDAWKAGFDANEANRVASGMLGHHLQRAEDNPNLVGIYMPVGDIEAAKAFASSPNLHEVMKKAGVITETEFVWMIPKRNAAILDRDLPGMIVQHSVADFDTWLSAYDATDGLRTANGIVGHAANQLMDDPSGVVVYHQAESFDTLRAFLALPELHAAMEAAGATSAPEANFYTGGSAKSYG